MTDREPDLEGDVLSDAEVREALVRKLDFLRESMRRVQMAIEAFDATRPKRRMIDEASRERISEAQKARWARVRNEKELKAFQADKAADKAATKASADRAARDLIKRHK